MKRMTHRTIIPVAVSILFFLFSACESRAHPHVFMSSSVEVLFDEQGLAGFKIRWSFDEMFSSMIIMDYDKNGNGRFEADEVATIKDEAFSNLKEFNYFTHIKIDGKPFDVKYVRDFQAQNQDNTLVYTFLVPCHVRASSSLKEIRLSIYDESYYSAVLWATPPVTFAEDLSFEVQQQMGIDKEVSYYFGQIHPEEITLRFKQKHG